MDRKILVVDDEAAIREWLAEAFEAEGYDPHVAENGQEAMEIIQREDIYVVVLDLKLFGMNGIELCKKIRQGRPLAIIYAMTGWGALFEVEECREAGFDDYFTKPMDTDMILHAIADAFAKIERWRKRPFYPAMQDRGEPR
ncbi:MAG: response regulator [Syntrophales bacterium]